MVLYLIWWLIPSTLLFLALMAFFDGKGNRIRRGEGRDLVRNAGFVSLCIVAAHLLDAYCLSFLEGSLIVEYLPLPFFRWLLLPSLLYVGAVAAGPSKAVKIAAGGRIKARTRGSRTP